MPIGVMHPMQDTSRHSLIANCLVDTTRGHDRTRAPASLGLSTFQRAWPELTLANAVLAAILAKASGLSTFQRPCMSTSIREAVATMMVDSWYDKGTRLSKDPAVESWYDNGMRLTEEPALPVGMSAAAAARSPELFVAALKSELGRNHRDPGTVGHLPLQVGHTMYGAHWDDSCS
jgi:hypothetical protein